MSALAQLAEELTEEARPKLRALIRELIAAEIVEKPEKPDPLLTVKEASAHTGLSQSTLRLLVKSGAIKRAPDISEIRIRQSVLDAYGK